MKRVFSNDMAVHVWAQQKQSDGRNSKGSITFEGPTLYSYRTPIATFAKGTRGRKAVLLSQERYSVTTAHHISMAWRAIDYKDGFVVPFLGVQGGRAFRHQDATNPRAVHAGNIASFLKAYEERKGLMLRARGRYSDIEHVQNILQADLDGILKYAEMFGIRIKRALLPDVADDARVISAKHIAREAHALLPSTIRKRERAAVRREERRAEQAERDRIAAYDRLQDEFVRYMTQDDTMGYFPFAYRFPHNSPERAFLEAAELERKQEKARVWRVGFDAWREGLGPLPSELVHDQTNLTADEVQAWHFADDARKLAEIADKIAAWREGGSVSLWGCPHTLMRVRGDNIETSRGATFPIAHGIRAWPFILRAKGNGWKSSGHGIALGLFHIDEITASGDVRAGCHLVKSEEVERMAATLRALGHDLGNGETNAAS